MNSLKPFEGGSFSLTPTFTAATSIIAIIFIYGASTARKRTKLVDYWQKNRHNTNLKYQRLNPDSPKRFTFFDNVDVVDDIALVRFNGPGKMNTISQALQLEASQLLEEHVYSNPSIKAVVFISSKQDSFIAGADVDVLKAAKQRSDFVEMCNAGHDFFSRLKKVASSNK
jgi:hypothetical protein